MSRIALIPIDNRPVCFHLPQQIISMAKEHHLYMPDRNLMGSLTKNANINAIFDWLKSLKDIDIFVISLDTIAYGGLISSRRSDDKYEQIKCRVDRLAGILSKHQAKVYAFSSIMRISNNNINEEEKEYWSKYGTKIFQYSYNLHKKQVNPQCINEIPEPDIPCDILEDYLNTRNRNFEINKYYIELKKKGLFDTLVFSKDDCAQFGLNVKEAELLREYSLGESNIFIKTGADEIPLALLSRAINKQKHIKIAPVYMNGESINKISKYEDITVEESVKSQIELCGGVYSDEADCDLVMLVNNFAFEQGELVMDVFEPLFNKELCLPSKPYFIADILNANGSDNNFVKALLEKEDLKEFFGYTAWNTTGNTLGSAISAALTYFGAKQPDNSAFKQLQLIRFLDDWAYQANVRGKIRNNDENLSKTVMKVNMKEFENILLNKFEVKKMQIEYKFPWNRFFEIEIILKKKYIKLPFVDILFYE